MASSSSAAHSLDSPPPSYEPSTVVVNQLPNLNIADLDTPTETPNSAQTICHLKLLNAINTLRREVSAHNGLFGLEDCINAADYDPDSPIGKAVSTLQDRIEEKRWAVYVARAVGRFTIWWNVMKAQHRAKPLTMQAMNRNAGSKAISAPVKVEASWPTDQMPPLDVLMIWHCFMLNPRAYLSDCLRQGTMSLWQRGMPWTAVNAVVDQETAAYNAGEQAIVNWQAFTKLPWDPLRQPDFEQLECPYCRRARKTTNLKAPWTTAGEYFPTCIELLHKSHGFTAETAMKEVERIAESGSGFADKHFRISCHACHRLIDHAVLQGHRFLADAQRLRARRRVRYHYDDLIKDEPEVRPMKGTILNAKGTLKQVDFKKSDAYQDPKTFPNRTVAAMMNVFPMPAATSYDSVDSVRLGLEDTLKSLDKLQFAMDTTNQRVSVSSENRKAIRRMMACYWNNSSPFSIDLAGACIRQGSFITKMAKIDWLHSPALASTVSRLLTKYTRFVHIMAKYPDDMAVPTLDVDLGWHTHQLSPRSYYDYTFKQTDGTFLDHDDKVAETTLDTAFKRTCSRYQAIYKEPYSECTCWYCEAIRAQHASSTSQRLLHSATNRDIEAQLHDNNTSHADASTAPHISAHNAIRPTRTAGEEQIYQARLADTRESLRVAYEKACKRARKEGRTPPSPPRPFIAETLDEKSGGLHGLLHNDKKKSRGFGKDEKDNSESGAAGPTVYPFMADPLLVSGGIYAIPPACASTASGSSGACAAGTCGGGGAGGMMGGMYGGGSGIGVGAGSCGGVFGGFGGGFGGGGCGGGGGGGGGCGGGGGAAC